MDRMFWGVMVLAVCVVVLALFAIYWSMPSPYRAYVAPPTDRDGYSYTCYCWRDPVRCLAKLMKKAPRSLKMGAVRRRRARSQERVRGTRTA